jgi:hypothetical protein
VWRRFAADSTERTAEMGQRFSVAIVVIAALSVLGGGAYAASRYVITSTKQIKPSVLKQFQARLNTFEGRGAVANMCPSGTDTTGQCEIGFSDARCPGGTTVLGGGLDGGSNPPVSATIGYSEPDRDGRGWNVVMANDGSTVTTFSAVAVCLGTVGRLTRVVRAGVPASVNAQIAREAAQVRTTHR